MIKYPFIKEIGDLSAKPYTHTKPRTNDGFHYQSDFKTDSGLDYTIDFRTSKRSPYLVVTCGFYISKQVGKDTEYDDASITNKGEMFRILSTFSNVFKEVEPEYKKVAKLSNLDLVFRISGTKKEGESNKVISARSRIYLHFLKASSWINSNYEINTVSSDNSIYLTPKKSISEAYTPVACTPKNVAKAAIRDIFIQMPTRTVHEMNWNGLLGQVVGVVGQEAANEAVEELKKEGWLSKNEELWMWRKMFGPVNPINVQPYFPSTYLEQINKIDKILREGYVTEATNRNIEVRPLATAEEMEIYKDYIMKHYLQNDAKNMKYKFGIFRNTDGAMVGIITYGIPTDAEITRRMTDENGAPLFTPDEIIELRRLWALDKDDLHNVESQAISLGNEEIVRQRPQTKVVVTFTDTSAGHTGTIYKATNAIEISSPGSRLKRFFYPVGNPTTKKIVTKKLLYFQKNYDTLRGKYNTVRKNKVAANKLAKATPAQLALFESKHR